MTLTDGLAIIVFLGLAAYAVLGGADFGAGAWDVTGDAQQRDLVTRAVAPMWEANHVWLIFVVITMFTAFPVAFGALSTALVAPLSVALLGIVLRGAAFVFRHYGAPHGGRPVLGTALWGRVFAASSLITPFAFGVAGGALVLGAPKADGSAGLVAPYLAPLPLLAGLVAVGCCAYLAAVYLSRDAERIGSDRLVRRFRRRALVSGTLTGGLALAALPLLPVGLARVSSAAGLIPVGVSATAGVLALVLLWRRRYRWARVAAASASLGLLSGWASALYPWALPGQVMLADFAAPPQIAGPVLAVMTGGLLVVLPCYLVMIRLLRVQPDDDRSGQLL